MRQYTTLVSVRFDDDAVADYFDRQVDLGRRPEQFARIWLHTHPGDSASPSHVDHVTFERVFGRCDWAVMFILARGGATFAQLRFNAGPGGALSLRTGVDYDLPFAGSDHEAWAAEFAACIEPERIASPMDAPPPDLRPDFPFFDDWEVDHVFG